MASSPHAMLPTSRRPIPMTARADLRCVPMHFRGERYWAIKDPVALRYHQLRDEQYAVLQLLDGERSLEDLRHDMQRRFPALHWGLTSLQALVSDLHEKRLLSSLRPGQDEGLARQRQQATRRRLLGLLMNFLFLRLPGWYPEPFLRGVYPFVRWMFHPFVVALCLLLPVAALLTLAVHFDQFRRQLPEFQQFFAWPNLLYLWCTLAVVKVFHELGHALTCRHFGGECHSIGIMLLVFSPTLYCDVSDAWMLPGKWKRILISAAGMYVEAIISAVALFVWWNTAPGTVHHLALNVFFVTTVTTVIFNANPLMRLDGYYILGDWLEIPNLRQRTDRYVLSRIGRWCFGIEPPDDPFEPLRGNVWLALYAVASGVYRWVLMLGIGWFLYTVLKPYRLQSLGVAVAALSVGGMVVRFVFQVWKMVRAPRPKPLSRKRMAISCGVVAALLVGLCAIPVPIYVEAAVLVQPYSVRHVYSQSPGRLVAVDLRPGERVAAEGRLARLSNPELEDRHRALVVESQVQLARIDAAIALSDPASRQLAEDHLQSLRSQLAELEEQLRRLEIVAPVAGVVVAAEPVPEPEWDRSDAALPRWSGSPLDPRNLGCFLEQRSHVASIAPDDRLEAVLLIDQSDRNELAVGMRIRMKFDHLPDRVYEGELYEISARSVEFVPASLSNKTGGPLATVTDRQGRERLSGVAWQAKVLLDRDLELFRTAFRGRARYVVAHKSLGAWSWRWLRETIHFRL